MRSPDLFIEEYGPKAGGRLFSIYALVLAWYVLAIFLAGIVGIEPLYMQVSPFYASAVPASKIAAIPTSVVLLGLILFAVTRRATGDPIARRYKFIALLAVVCVVLLMELVAATTRQGVSWADFWKDFRWELPFLAVVSIATIAALRSFRRVAWWDDEITKKAAWRVVMLLALFSFALAGSVAMLRGGPAGIATAYNRTHYEYIDDIGKGVTLLGFLRNYNELHPLLSMHAKVHPPGPVVMLWMLSSIFFSRDPLTLSLATMAVGCLAIFPLFAWVRDMLGQRVAITACAMYALMPSIVIFTATSADILFMPLLILTLFLFWRAIHKNSMPYAVGAGVIYALMSLSSFSLLTIGAFFAFVGLWRMSDTKMRAAVIKTAVAMSASFLLFHAAVRLTTGFDIVECFRLSQAQFIADQVKLDEVQPRYPSWTFKFFNPLCWVFFAGVPASVLFLWRLVKPNSTSKSLFIVFAFTLLVIAPLYLARGEGERSAMYVLPFIVIPAAHLLNEFGERARSLRPMAMTFLFLVAQSWLIETYLYTFW